MKMLSRKKQAGFTLLEVLVAIGIFSLVAMISYSTLDTYIAQRERLTEHYGKLERLQRLFILLERDIQFSVPRNIRIGGDTQAAIVSENGDVLIALTVAQADINSVTGIALKRVEWRMDGEELIRSQWNVLDHTGNVEPAELLVSDELSNMEFSYILYSPTQGLDTKTSLASGEFPLGILLTVSLASDESYRRVFAVAHGG